MDKYIKTMTVTTLLLAINPVFSYNLTGGKTSLQLGGYWSSQGQAQHINIQDLIGDNFSVTKRQDSNGLVGVSYFVDGFQKEKFNFNYGINAFYLGKTAVNGTVTQEDLFTNLAYGYHLSHVPVLAVVKSSLDLKSPQYAVTIDVGIGPNFMFANDFQEYSLDGITVPDYIFSSHTTTTFSAMAGIGVKYKNFFGQAPLECGYKFFYLGQGNFNTVNSQVINTLNTGSDFANALMCSITV